MRQLKCEICGSSSFVKQDGMFVCQVCGTKYSTEEAQKLMVEVPDDFGGPVRSSPVKTGNNSDLVNTYMRMAENALDASNNAEAETYSNKVIELDPQNYKAWTIKGEAAGWQSTLANSRISETINAFINAVQFCPSEEREEVGEHCKEVFVDLHLAMLSLRLDHFKNHPNETDYNEFKGDIDALYDNASKFLEKTQLSKFTDIFLQTGRLTYRKLLEAWQAVKKTFSEDSNGHPSDRALSNFISEGGVISDAYILVMKAFFIEDPDNPSDQIGIDYNERYSNPEANELMIAIYNELININITLKGAVSYDVDFSSGVKRYVKSKELSDKAKESRDFFIKLYQIKIGTIQRVNDLVKKNIIERYWAEHAEEKEKLDQELAELQETEKQYVEQINAIHKKLEQSPALEKLNQIKSKIEKLTADKKALGMFKAKQKQEIQEQIDAAEIEERVTSNQVAIESKKIEEEMKPIKASLDKVLARIKEIQTELTKER